MHDTMTLAIFALVYLGMALGRWPKLMLDRTGIALCGAIAVVLLGDGAALAAHVDFAALALLFGLMVLSAQFAAAGFYGWCAARIAATRASPAALLGLTVAVTGGLSSVLANDVVVFAMTPILCRGLVANGRNPLPYLLALAGAANAGSAATLVGNPQNILIAEHGDLGFWSFAAVAAPPALAALAVVYLTIWAIWRHELAARPETRADAAPDAAAPALDRPALLKGALATVLLLALFATDLPRWQAALAVAGVLLVSRRLSTREMLAFVDWHLLVLLAGLFVVTGAVAASGLEAAGTGALGLAPATAERPAVLAAASLLGSNTVGNVPFVVLALAAVPDLSADALHALAVLSTLAGNLLVVGSLANIIVLERAKREGVVVGFGQHARSGIAMTVIGMTLALMWFAWAPV